MRNIRMRTKIDLPSLIGLLGPLALLILLVLQVLTACTTQIAQTPKQRYFAVKQDYITALTAASGYAAACRAKPTKSCVSKVKMIQMADDSLAALFKAADAAVLTDEKDEANKLDDYVNALDFGIAELHKYTSTNN